MDNELKRNPTHKLNDVLACEGVLVVRFSDGHDFEVSGCHPVDYSIYRLNGGWCGSVERYLGNSEKKNSLFRPNSGIDFYEDDIISIEEKTTGKILYRRTQSS
jgi:hypothetical protein